jgi:hypothetical protein
LTLTLDGTRETLLTDPVVDQAALHGVLRKMCDLGLQLVSVNCITPGGAAASAVEQEMERRH